MELSTIDEPTEHTETGMKTEKRKIAIWVKVEAMEVIELKRIVLDRKVPEAVDFFQAVIAPQVHTAAKCRGIRRMDVEKTDDGHLSG